jgi:RNA polymerase sigma-70 factor (ECF subfamily)
MNQAEHDLLVIDAQDGSRTAMNALVAHHHRDLLRFAYSLCRNTALAQDAVQDAWIKVVRRLRRLNDPRAFRGWVYHAVRWRVLDLLRRADRGDCELDQAPALADAASDGELRDRRIDLGAAIARLAAIDRETLQLHYAAGLTIPEIAAVQEVPPGTVKSRLHRARNQLAQTLEGDNDEH